MSAPDRAGTPDLPQVWNVVLARLISGAGAEAAFFIGLWGKAAFVFEGTPTDLAVMSATIGVAAIIGSAVGGALVDRFDARRVVLMTEIAVVPTSLALILAQDIPSLVAIGALSWLAGSALEAAIASLPPAMVADEQLDRANARLEGATWLALVLGPGVGALLSGAFGIDSVFVLDALTSLAAIAFVWRISLDPRLAADQAPSDPPAVAGPVIAPSGAVRGSMREIREGLAYAMRTPEVRLPLYLQSLLGVAFGVFIALEPLYFRDVLGTQIEAVGYVNVVFGLGMFLGSVTLDRTKGRLTSYRVNVVLSTAAGVGSVVYSGTDSLVWVVVGACVWSLPLGMSLPMSRTLAQRSSEERYVGRVTGAFGIVQSAAGLLPIVVAPALAAAVGVQLVLVFSGATAIILSPLVWREARRLDDEVQARKMADVAE